MKTVYELSAQEIDELRGRYIIELDINHDNISDEEVRQYYTGTSFIEEDFFKNMNKIYCDVCDQASVETVQIITEETFYCCTMCRDNNKDREIKDNNFDEGCVIDYAN